MSNKEEPPCVTVHVHLDSLEYSRTGVKTKTPLDLTIGHHHKVSLVRPTRRRPLPSGNRGFPHNSSLPLVGTLRVMWAWAAARTALIHEAGGRMLGDEGVLQLFAHTSRSGDEAYNKQLSDRRAEVGRSLVSGDPAFALAVAAAEGWGLREGQSMLRCLGCDPGPLDGVAGKLSTAAIVQFQERFNRGVFHERSGTSVSVELVEDGEWSERIRDALVEALVAVHGLHVGDSGLHPMHPAHGCSEFNAPQSDVPDDARRLTLIHHPTMPEFPDAAPCTKADDLACAVVDEDRQRCFYYREHVSEHSVSSLGMFDPRWLWIAEDRYVLSVLTDAPDGDEVIFEVFDVDGGRDDERVNAVPPRARISATASMGAASVVWKSELSWLEDGCPVTERHPAFVATHVSSSTSVSAPYPRRGVFRVMLGDAAGTRQQHSREFLRVVASDGSYDESRSVADDAIRLSPRELMLEFQDAPLDVLSSVFYGFGPQASIRWVTGVRLGEASASRYGSESIDTPRDDPPNPEEWVAWEHADRCAAALARYKDRDPLPEW